MTHNDALERLTRVTRNVRVSRWRLIAFGALLIVSMTSALLLALISVQRHAFPIGISLMAAAISVYVLVTGYKQRRF